MPFNMRLLSCLTAFRVHHVAPCAAAQSGHSGQQATSALQIALMSTLMSAISTDSCGHTRNCGISPIGSRREFYYSSNVRFENHADSLTNPVRTRHANNAKTALNTHRTPKYLQSGAEALAV